MDGYGRMVMVHWTPPKRAAPSCNYCTKIEDANRKGTKRDERVCGCVRWGDGGGGGMQKEEEHI